LQAEWGPVTGTGGGVTATPAAIRQGPLDQSSTRLSASENHFQNWLDCIKSRRDPICSVEVGHRSATVCHLGNIAIRSGKKVNWDPLKESIVGDAELARWTSRPYRAPWVLPAV